MKIDMTASRASMDLRAQQKLNAFVSTSSALKFPEFQNPDASIVIVAYGQPALLYATIESLYTHIAMSKNKFRVTVVDNTPDRTQNTFVGQISGIDVLYPIENLGFGPGCNLGSEKYKNSDLIFLNPDVELCPGCLDNLLETLRSDNDVGIVGGRLLFLNGEVQEAGGYIINDDQITYGYQRGSEDINQSSIMCRRDVFYVSGCLLAIKRDLYSMLRGFDDSFAPAYFEDTDLCIRALKSGYRVVYEPRATAFHYENATMKNREDVDERLTIKRKIFKDKHFDYINSISRNRCSFAEAREKPHEFRVLFIDDAIPQGSSGAGFPRSRDVINAMAMLGYFVTAVGLYEQEAFNTQEIHPTVEVVPNLGLNNLSNFVEQRTGFYDLLWVSRPHNIWGCRREFGPKLFDRSIFRSGVVFDGEAIFSIRDIIKDIVVLGYVDVVKGRNLIRSELDLYKGADVVVTVSEKEKSHFAKSWNGRLAVLGHYLRSKKISNDFKSRNGFLFVGNLEHEGSPNSDSLAIFLDHCWHQIRETVPHARLDIVGRGSKRFEHKGLPGVQCLGEVGKLDAIFERPRVFIAPTRYAGGIPHKIHEATAAGLPCVMTSLLAHQLDWQDGQECLYSGWNDMKDFAMKCCVLHEQEDLWLYVQSSSLNAIRSELSEIEFLRRVRDICEYEDG